jgi:hypothetical protein
MQSTSNEDDDAKVAKFSDMALLLIVFFAIAALVPIAIFVFFFFNMPNC